MDTFRATRGLFISTVGALLAACSNGLGYVSGALMKPSSGQWRIASPQGFTDCEDVTVLNLRLPASAAASRIVAGQILLSETRANGDVCHISPTSSRRLPLTVRMMIERLARKPDGSAAVLMTSGSIRLDKYSSNNRQSVVGASGPASFKFDKEYLARLKQLGFAISMQQAIKLGFAHVTIEDVTSIAKAFPNADLDDIRAFRRFGLPASDALEFHRVMPSLDMRNLLHLIGMGVTPAYIERLRKAGGEDPTISDIMSARFADLTTDRP